MRDSAVRRPVPPLVSAKGWLALSASLFLAPTPAPAQGFPLWNASGTGAIDLLGSSVATAGDADLDGVPDVVVGAMQLGFPPNFPAGTGYAQVFSGATGLPIPGLTFLGTTLLGATGQSVAGPGDVNADGAADLVVGPMGFAQLRVFGGLSGTLLFSIGAFGETLGTSATPAGDVNGDGVPDVLAGDPTTNPTGAASTGRARVYSGVNGLVLRTFNGTVPDLQLGWSVAAVGDVDGDLVPDFAAGAPLTNPGGNVLAGRAKIFSGASSALLLTVDGTGAGDQAGWSVAGPGDLNGDGLGDLLVGAPHADPGGLLDAGEARIHSGANGAVLFTFSGTAAGEELGYSVAAAGDVDGDGAPESLVGADRANAGAVVVAGRATLFSGASGAPLLTVSGSGAGDQLGFAVAGGGDFNGDGIPDLVLGAAGASPGGVLAAGQVRVVSVAGLAPGTSLLGAGCPGSGGFTPLILTAGGAPSIGNADFDLVLSRALGGSTALLILGASSTSWGGVALPLNLAFLGLPSCNLSVSVDLLFPATATGSGPGTGRRFLAVPVPPDPLLVGGSAFFQWYVEDPGPLPLPGAMSPALQIVVM